MATTTTDNNENVSDLLKYKKAKIITTDIEQINKLISKVFQDLYPFKKYVPVRDILTSLSENKTVLNLHLKKNKKIVKTKGLIGQKD